ncbi:hypothetical protein KM043_014817 [Ampulex compressa]|nr:hypothetical protein KM043_014817 [Ampulex compressa]
MEQSARTSSLAAHSRGSAAQKSAGPRYVAIGEARRLLLPSAATTTTAATIDHQDRATTPSPEDRAPISPGCIGYSRLMDSTWKECAKDPTVLQRNFLSENNQEPKKREKKFHFQDWLTRLASDYAIVENWEKLCGFKLSDFSSFENFTRLLYRPTDSASLGVVRALFGLCMVLDVVEERGFADVDIKWGDPWDCHFPLIHGMRQPSLPWVIVLYTIMWIGAFGVMLGFHFKTACACFVVPYWYIFLLDKSYWNNHTYLYGIVASLFWCMDANKYFALDASKCKRRDSRVPFWNYFILKFQFFALYFLAGMKKSSREWLEGYAMMDLSRHWVFEPFKIFLTTEQTDFFVVHWFAFIFDLTVGFWMLFDKTRIPAMIFCTLFHLMNSRLFCIGMFPYVCLATMPLFCSVDWPRRLRAWFVHCLASPPLETQNGKCLNKTPKIDSNCDLSPAILSTTSAKNCDCRPKDLKLKKDTETETRNLSLEVANSVSKSPQNSVLRDVHQIKAILRMNRAASDTQKVTKRQKFVVSLLLLHVALQFFLPYSHFITKGYNNWVPGLYGYSWDMMVHTWDTILVVIRVHDNASNEDHYLDPRAWVQNDRWEKHGDMARQYAFCLKENLIRQREEASIVSPRYKDREKWSRLSSNLSIYMDVWCSLNGRFQQRVFNPNVDILTTDWHPFKPISYLMPLLTQYNSYRYKLAEIQQHVYTWSNYTDVLFVADFPGLQLENYICNDFTNVTLTVLEGEVTYSDDVETSAVTVPKGESIAVRTGKLHKIKTTSAYPACYTYTYTNSTRQESEMRGMPEPKKPGSASTIIKEINYKISAWSRALSHIANAFFYLVYDVPMIRRIRVNNIGTGCSRAPDAEWNGVPVSSASTVPLDHPIEQGKVRDFLKALADAASSGQHGTAEALRNWETCPWKEFELVSKLGQGSGLLWTIFIFTITPTIFNGMHSMSYIFIAEVPSHWCSIPELAAANWTDEQIRNISSASPCTKYDYNYTHFAQIGFEAALKRKNDQEPPPTQECSVRTFARDIRGTSFVEDWDLVCERAADRSSTHMALSLGKLLGSAFFGIFADKYGRKTSYVIGIILLIVSGPASAIVPWYWAFMVLRLFTGVSHAAIQYSSFTILTEIAGEKHRQWMGIAYNTGYASGIALIAGVAYIFTDWKHIQLAISAPAIVLVIHMWLMPESPRWLMSQGRRKEARKLIEKSYGPVYDAHSVSMPVLKSADDASSGEKSSAETNDAKERLRKNIVGVRLVVTNPELRRRIVITNISWMTASLSYYALALNVDNFSADRYIYVLVMGLTEIPAYIIPTPILMFIGRRQASAILYSGAALCLLSILMIPTTYTAAIMTVALIGRFTLSAVYGIVILFTSELFPTVSRNSAVGMNSAMSHVGSVAAPYVADLLGAVVWWGPSTLCGGLALVAGLLCSILPETRGRSLADTIEEELAEGRERVAFENCRNCSIGRKATS